ncbi:MAG TPA: cellulase family glycosylhydrolase [Mycobacteriales bacterium]|nr:cellulase family glycosylhydrolase [Mycobacteriales bacterium]
MLRLRRFGLAGLIAAATALAPIGGHLASATTAAPVLKIAGNHFVTGSGGPTRIFAVHFGTSEYDCVEPLYNDARKKTFSIPTSDAAMQAITTWHVNTIRIPLNEQCWLGVNPVKRYGQPDYHIKPLTGSAATQAGAALRKTYRAAIKTVVHRAHSHGLAVILDLHWSAAGKAIAFNQWPLPDRQYSIPFWRSVAKTFKSDHSMAFEIFNEPFRHNPGTGALTLTWKCLRDGCTVPNACGDCGPTTSGDLNTKGCGNRCPHEDNPLGTYKSAGTQDLVDAIRATGAKQPILVPGRTYTNDLSSWLEYMPHDPQHQLAATFHAYEGLSCDNTSCWDNQVAPVAAKVPVVTTEFGGDAHGEEDPCTRLRDYDEAYMDWADSAGVSYGGFSWERDYFDYPAPRCDGYSMLAKWDGTPRYGHGRAIHDHFVAVAP